MLTALAISVYYRLNKVLVFLAANISVPPLTAVVIYLSYVVGGLWMGDEAQTITFDKEISIATVRSNFFQYGVGAVTLAILAGLLFGVVTYALLKIKRRVK